MSRWLVYTSVVAALCACGDDTPNTPPPQDASADAPVDAATAPAAPTGFTAIASATGVDLAWTPPSDPDYASVIVVRRAVTAVASAPVPGTSYTAGGTLGSGDTVIYAGTATSFADTEATPGMAHYAVFAANTALAWSPPARASALAPAGLQEGTLTVTLAGGPAVAVNQQPAHVMLAATAAYDGAAQTLTIELTVTSGFVRNMFSPKIVVTAVDEGTLTSDGTLAGSPFRRAGIGLAPAAQATVSLELTGVTAAIDPVNFTVRIVDHPIVLVGKTYNSRHGYGIVDTATLEEFATAPCDTNVYAGGATPNSNGYCSIQGGAVSPDASRVYAGHRSLPVIRAIDATTAQTVAVTSLATGVGAVTDVALDPTGQTAYALLVIGAHMYAGGTVSGAIPADSTRDIVLVKLDAATLTEQARLVLATGAPSSVRGRRVAISLDGTRAAVAMLNDGHVRLIDLATFTEIDTDSVAPGTQAIDLSATDTELKQVEFTADGTALYALFQSSSGGVRVSLADYTTTATALSDSTENSGGLSRAADGTLWAAVARDAMGRGLVAIDAAGTLTPIATGASGNGVLVVGDRVWLGTRNQTIELYDASTHARIDVDGDASNGDTDIPMTQSTASHWMTVTPF